MDTLAETHSATAAKPRPDTISVVVEKNVTLRHLCLLYLDRFDVATIAAIRRLNPRIVDPDRVRAGDQIRLPLYLRRGFRSPSPNDGAWQPEVGSQWERTGEPP